MTTWTGADLAAVGDAEEIDITAVGSDEPARRSVTIWVVRVEDDLYVRSVRGRTGRWFGHAVQSLQGRIRAGSFERDVSFEEPDPSVQAAIDDAYRTKYARYSSSVSAMTTPDAIAATFRLLPR